MYALNLAPEHVAYCDIAKGHKVHGPYHDLDYGTPQSDDRVLFERMVLEINQAGLSWLTILNKRSSFSTAYHGFAPEIVAAYGEEDVARLLSDPAIIRNKLKINAAIHNAQQILRIKESHGSFHQWLLAHHPLTKEAWVKLFKQNFRFMGGEIVGEFLMSLGYLPGAHGRTCWRFHEIIALSPPWLSKET